MTRHDEGLGQEGVAGNGERGKGEESVTRNGERTDWNGGIRQRT